MFKINDSLETLLQVSGWGMDYFYRLHGWAFIICVLIAQVRHRAMSAGLKEPQEILRLPSVNFSIKKLAHDDDVTYFGAMYSMDKVLPYRDNTDPEYINDFRDRIIIGKGKATKHLASNAIISSEENKEAFARGHFRSLIGKLSTIPIYNPSILGR